jgi:hypothetical protein
MLVLYQVRHCHCYAFSSYRAKLQLRRIKYLLAKLASLESLYIEI